jgi:hypothetical protein
MGKENDNCLLSSENEWKSEWVFRDTRAICCGALSAIVSSTDSLLSKKIDIYTLIY